MTSTYTYKNGLRLIYQKSDSKLPVSSVLVFIKFGSIHQPIQKGIAHFIEHMCFKGTRQLPTSNEVTRIYDRIGAYLNASTYKEYTDYIVKCNDEYLANCIDVLSDMVLHSEFKPKNMNLEKHVVKEETIRLEDDPEYNIYKMSEKLLYKGTAYENPIDDLSYHESQNSLPNIDVLDLYNRFYQPHNMGISIVSNLSFDIIKRMISRTYFIKKSTKIDHIPREIYIISTPLDVQVDIRQKKGINATHLNIAFRICEYGHPDMYRLQVLANILGGYMSSRMFIVLREKHGVTYKSTCTVDCYQPTGQLSLYTMCDPTKMMRNSENIGVLELIVKLLKKLVKYGVTKKEVDDAKGNLKGKFLQSLENPQNPCVHNGREYIVYDNPNSIPYQSLYDTYYAKVTNTDLNEMIQKYIKRESMIVCLFGEHVPKKDAVMDVIDKML